MDNYWDNYPRAGALPTGQCKTWVKDVSLMILTPSMHTSSISD